MKDLIKNIKSLNSKLVIWLIRNNAISVLVAVLIIWMFWEMSSPNTSIYDWFDFSVLSSIIFAFIIAILGNTLSIFINNKIEDGIKLTTDYETLTSNYMEEFYKYTNAVEEGVSQKNLDLLYKKERVSKKSKEKSSYKFEFPVTYDANTYKKEIKFCDSNTDYQLPQIVEDNIDELIKAHNTTVKYNQLMIRIDHWYEKNNIFHIHSSRTTYIQSLVTNRAIDYELENGLSIRKLFDYGPLVVPLEKSKLSNHLGFNGFIESSDGYIPLVRRGARVSVGKNTYATSVSGSVKSKYVFADNEEVHLDGIKNTIINEITDELKIDSQSLKWGNTNEHLFAWYRDMVEGGKPHFIFYVKVKETKKMIEENFKKAIRRKRIFYNSQIRMLEDANKLVWIHKSELQTLAISPRYIVYNEKAYTTLPSYSASLAILIDHLRNCEQI